MAGCSPTSPLPLVKYPHAPFPRYQVPLAVIQAPAVKVLLGRLGINHHSHVFTELSTGLPSLIRLCQPLEAHRKIDVARPTVTCLGRGEGVYVCVDLTGGVQQLKHKQQFGSWVYGYVRRHMWSSEEIFKWRGVGQDEYLAEKTVAGREYEGKP